jgi:transcriptional regulator with XRE-family HTH domain
MNGPTLLKTWRTERKLSQEEAAEKVEVHQNTWSDWENGNKVPRAEMVLRLHVLTEAACPVDAWTDDQELQRDYRAGLKTGTE